MYFKLKALCIRQSVKFKKWKIKYQKLILVNRFWRFDEVLANDIRLYYIIEEYLLDNKVDNINIKFHYL